MPSEIDAYSFVIFSAKSEAGFARDFSGPGRPFCVQASAKIMI
jgi:hypothetical protein